MNPQTSAAPNLSVSSVVSNPEVAAERPLKSVAGATRFMTIAKDGDPVDEISDPTQMPKEPHILWMDTECEDLQEVAEMLRKYLPDAPKTLSHKWLVESSRSHLCAEFAWIEELVPTVQCGPDPHFSFDKLRLLVGKNFLITMHAPDSRKIDGIWGRFLESDMLESHYDSPSVIASVVLEECLAQACAALDDITPYLDMLSDTLTKDHILPDHALSRVLPHITKNMAKLEQYAGDYPKIMHSLSDLHAAVREKDCAVTNGQSMAESQGRIAGSVGKLMGMIRRRETISTELRQTLDAFSQEKQNKLSEQLNQQMKDLTILGSVVAIGALVIDVIQGAGATYGSIEGRSIIVGGLCSLLGLSIWFRRKR